MVFLTPLNKFRFEIDFFVSYLVNIYKFAQNLFLHKSHTGIITFIQIEGSNQSFKGITTHIVVMTSAAAVADN